MPELNALRELLLRNGQITISVKVVLRAARTQIADITGDGTVRIKLAAVPEKGRANEELRRFLAEYFGVSKNSVELISGETAQYKRIRISA